MNLQEAYLKLKNILMEDLADAERLAVSLIFGLLIFLAFFYLSKWIKKLVSNRINKSTKDPLWADFIAAGIRGIIMVFGITLVFRFMGLTGLVSGMLAGAGITAFIIGFALKDIGENFLAGIMLAFKRPFRIGDFVEINGIHGKVLALNLRDTQIKTGDGKDVFIPNASIIKSPLINFTMDGFLSYEFIVGLDYGSDYQKAIKLIRSTLTTIPGILSEDKSPTVFIDDLAPSSLTVKITYWVDTYNPIQPDLKVRSSAILSVLQALESAGFKLPGKIVELKKHQDGPVFNG